MADRLTDAQLIERLKARKAKPNATVAELAAQFGVAPRGFQSSLAAAKARGLSASTPVVGELAKAKAQLQMAKAEAERLRKEAITVEEVRETIYGLAKAQAEVPDWLVKMPSGDFITGVPMTIWSDWHFGEVVNAAEVAGVNTFNRIVAEARVRTLVEKTIMLCKKHMTRPNYPGIVVCLGGDFITGSIHEELLATNWGGPAEQLNVVTESVIWALEQMAKVFKKVFVPCVVGNHGRTTMKPRKKGAVMESYEWLMYLSLQRHFRNDKRFVFSVPDETDAYFKVYGHRFLLTHGDNLAVKGGDGIIGVLGPMARGAVKLGRSEAQIGRDFDTLLIGHYHTYVPRGDAIPMIANGSVIGYNEYARLGLRVPYSRPSQALWFVHPEHGITAQWQIYLDGRNKSQDTANWLTFEQRMKA